MNVAAYCRVSTDQNDQANSFENQKKFFESYSHIKPEYNVVKIYADEGISGTQTSKRDAFNAMIDDAYAGKFDYIITKEVSRFARNTVDTLQYIRKLKSHNVGVYFINDNIDTLSGQDEFRLTIMAGIAQEESHKTSERVKWGMRQQMKNGYVFINSMLGYDCNNGVLTINKPEAEIVREIFYKYTIEGKGTTTIARELTWSGAPLTKTMKRWSPTTISRILKNEKYVGDLLQQKTYTPNYLTHKTAKNDGKLEKILIENHHEPIIDRELWNKTQDEIARRRNISKYDKTKYSNTYWCSGKLFCGECGRPLIIRTKNIKSGKYRAWRCKTYYFYKNKDECSNSNQINEKVLTSLMDYAIKQISLNKARIKSKFVDALKSIPQNGPVISKEQEFEKLENKKKQILKLLSDDVITPEEFVQLKNDVDKKLKQFYDIEKPSGDVDINSVINQIENIIDTNSFSKETYGSILNKIIVYPDKRAKIFLNGISEPIDVKFCSNGRGKSYDVTIQNS